MKLMQKKSILLDSIGYESLYDFLATVFTFKEKTIIPFLSTILTFSLSAVSGFVDKVIYTPSLAIIVLFGVSILDTILGASVAIKEGTGVDAYKLGRSAVRFVIQIFFVTLLFQLSVLYGFIPKQVVDVFLLIFTLSTFWSGVTNAYKLDLITKEQYNVMQSFISFKKIIEKFTREKDV